MSETNVFEPKIIAFLDMPRSSLVILLSISGAPCLLFETIVFTEEKLF